MQRPLAVAVTGGIAAGKSEALAAFARHGAAVVSSDEIVHGLYRGDDELAAAVRARWGDPVFSHGEVDRAAVGRIVFSDRDELAWLESVMHPLVRSVYESWLARVRAEPDPPALAVIEIPLLYETGGEQRFDKVVAITASEPVRLARGGAHDGRESRLIPDDEKIRRADYAYVNDGSLDDLDVFVAGVVEELASC
jgi:dephospho-CoA kinase